MLWIIDECGTRNNSTENVALSVVAHAYNSKPWRCKQDEEELKVILSYVVGSRPAFAARRPSPKKIIKNYKGHY